MMSANLHNQAFLEELYRQWNQNPVVATLKARLRPMEIPVEVIQIAGDLQRQSEQEQQRWRERRQMNDAIDAQLGSLGISGGGSSFCSGIGINSLLI